MRAIAMGVAGVVGAAVLPGLWFQGGAWQLWLGSDGLQDAHAERVDQWIDARVEAESYGTGSALFDGEWWFATHAFAALGHLQLAEAHPDHAERHLDRAEQALKPLMRCEGWRFDSRMWEGQCALARLGTSEDHAVLGYLNLPLTLLVQHRPDHPWARQQREISVHLARRLRQSPTGVLHTYPDRGFPVDTAFSVASLGLQERVGGAEMAPLVERWEGQMRARFLDENGLLRQYAKPDGRYVSEGRGSGTMLAAYALSFAGGSLDRQLWATGREVLYGELLGFGAILEGPDPWAAPMDIDSGPVVLGYGVSATGFAIGAAAARGDGVAYRHLSATSALFGGPAWVPGMRGYAVGGPLGDSLMFAFHTAQRR